MTAAVALLSLLVTSCFQSTGKIDEIFPRGKQASAENFTGAVWSRPVVSTDSVFNYSSSSVVFSPSARTHYHRHDEGQILICLSGRGWYQAEGEEPVEMHPGDVVKIPPHVKHWHGAAKDSGFNHLTMLPHQKNGTTEWLEEVDETYYQTLK